MKTPNHILTAALALVLASLACAGINLPVRQFQTGPTKTVDIQVPLPSGSSSDVELNLEFLGGDLKLAPGPAGSLVSGTAIFNLPELEPKVLTSGSSYTLRQGEQDLKGIPNIQGTLKNSWDLRLADTPMSLDVKAGAYNGDWELGGLSLKKLTINEGASQLTGGFSEPNHVEMSSFTFSTGASTVNLKGLANANFGEMTFTSGAGDYTLSFDGTLKRDASVHVDAGVGTVTLIVPQGANARLTFDGGLSTVNPDSHWTHNGNVYELAGSGPTLTFTVKMGAGTLNLRTE